MSLFSARWVLKALGEVDFGLFGVVGSIILLVTFLNGALSVGVGRFYAYSIGQGENIAAEAAGDDLNRWFNTAFSIHLLLPIILIPIGWPIGEYAIHHWLTIPAERIDACVWLFRVSLIGAFVGVFSVPFTSMYTAHQLIVELAVFNIIRSLGTFVGAWFLMRAESDRLVFYGIYMIAITAGTLIVQIFRAAIKFPACRPCLDYMYDRGYLRKLFAFVGWKMFGMSCVAFQSQGTPVLANLFYGPAVNAAYSVANRLSIQATTLSAAMTGAFQPALTSAEGKGNRKAMLGMATKVSKFGSLLVMFFVVPLFLEMDSVLVLWLENPPKHSGVLCRWMLLMLLIDKLTAGQMLAVNAFGKIAAYELIQGSVIFLTLPMIWILYRLGYGPPSLGVALFVSTLIYCIGRVIFFWALFKESPRDWIRWVVIPTGSIAIGSYLVGAIVMSLLDPGLVRLLSVSGLSTAFVGVTGWIWLLDHQERRYALNVLAGGARKLKLRTSLL